MPVQALQGIRVADFSWVIAGPVSTKYMGAMGAEIIRIESAARPDMNRGPDLPLQSGFMATNFSKRSCTINLSTPRGLELAKEIVRQSDVVVENFAYGVMERLGLGYDDLRAIKPDIIMASSAGLGKTGPYKHHVAYGMLVASYSGINSISGYEGGRPRGLGAPWNDPLTGLYLCISILAALQHRKRTGEGQFIDISMAEPMATQMPEAFLDYTMYGNVSGPRGNMEEGAAPHSCYPCQGEDKWVAIAVTNEDQWEAFCQAIGSPAWCRDPRFADGYRRFQNRQELDRLVGEWTKQYTHYQVMDILQAAGVPSGPSLDTKELVENPHLQARGFYATMDHPTAGPIQFTGMPWQLQPDSGFSIRTCPTFGQDNGYVFGEVLGMSETEIAELMQQKVIY